MERSDRWVVFVMVAALPLVGCGEPQKAAQKGHAGSPALVESTEDPAIKRITLSEQAIQRLGIQVADVTGAGQRLEAPYSALFYDGSGGEWVYVSPQPMVFIRAGIKVERIDGDKMYLSQGPAAGTKVVVAGAAILYGAETGL
jgi:hypothetical protein